MAVLDSRVYKQIERQLYEYYELRHQVDDLANEADALLNPGRTPASPGGGGTSHRSDPTATNTLRRMQLSERKQAAEGWVAAIELAISRYEPTKKGQLLELKYFSKMKPAYICFRLYIDRATYFRWCTEIVTHTALVAAQFGLIKVT